MATLAIYGGHHPGFITTQSIPPQIPQTDDQFITTFFCRALYDYQSSDPSFLSFHRDDIIEVLTQLESGWWDGLLADERGWFPSNYVIVISDEEAEAALAASDPPLQNQALPAQTGPMSDQDRHWLESEFDRAGTENGLLELANATMDQPSQSSDFWMPQVTPDGQIYYVNTQTGQHSRDLPQEAGDETSDGELAGLTTNQASSRAGTGAGLGFSSEESGDELANAPFLRRNATPEPWVRKLADDGMSYYYLNKLNGQIEWVKPDQDRQNRGRLSMYSDDSDIRPFEERFVQPPPNNNDVIRARKDPELPEPVESFATELTSAERLAQSLQESLAPPPPALVTELSESARAAIAAVVENVQMTGFTRRPEDDLAMDRFVHAVVLAVRNLLYISSTPPHIPSNVLPRDVKDHQRVDAASLTLLKPAQRKVTATLSKLVLSARAMQYDSRLEANSSSRIESDAEELERAVVAFVLAAERCRSQELPDATGGKRLFGVFSTANVGLGLVGAGTAGSWKGLGFVALEDDDEEAPRKVLGTEIVGELGSRVRKLEEKLAVLALSLKDRDARQVHAGGQDVVTQLSTVLMFLAKVHIARHVDIDGISQGTEASAANELYAQTIDKARLLVRTLETGVQSLYDDGSALLLAVQTLLDADTGDRQSLYEHIESLTVSSKANLGVVQKTLEELLSVGHDQADMAQGDYNGSIEWRMSRLSMIDNQFGGALRPVSTKSSQPSGYESDGGDVIDIEHAFRPQGSKIQDNGNGVPEGAFPDASSEYSGTAIDTATTRQSGDYDSSKVTLVASDSLDMVSPLRSQSRFDDDGLSMMVPPPARPGPRRGDKLRDILGDEAPQHYIESVNDELKPWYLRLNYNPAEILIDHPDGFVRGGTVPALVERLTAHEHGGEFRK